MAIIFTKDNLNNQFFKFLSDNNLHWFNFFELIYQKLFSSNEPIEFISGNNLLEKLGIIKNDIIKELETDEVIFTAEYKSTLNNNNPNFIDIKDAPIKYFNEILTILKENKEYFKKIYII